MIDPNTNETRDTLNALLAALREGKHVSFPVGVESSGDMEGQVSALREQFNQLLLSLQRRDSQGIPPDVPAEPSKQEVGDTEWGSELERAERDVMEFFGGGGANAHQRGNQAGVVVPEPPRLPDMILPAVTDLSDDTPAAVAATGAAGTGTEASRDDHVHAVAQALLSATHTDTTADDVVRGDLVTGQGADPDTTWKRLVIGTEDDVLQVDASGDAIWGPSPNQSSVDAKGDWFWFYLDVTGVDTSGLCTQNNGQVGWYPVLRGKATKIIAWYDQIPIADDGDGTITISVERAPFLSHRDSDPGHPPPYTGTDYGCPDPGSAESSEELTLQRLNCDSADITNDLWFGDHDLLGVSVVCAGVDENPGVLTVGIYYVEHDEDECQGDLAL